MTTHVLHWLLTEPHWLATQGLIQNSSGVLMIWAFLMMWHHSCDAHWWCWRPGRFDVKGTTWKTCSNHTSVAHHKRLHLAHRILHPSRHDLTSGEDSTVEK